MSNAIRYDSLLVRHLADALRARLVGRPCHPTPVRLDDRTAALPLDAGDSLRFDLHPAAGWIRLGRDPRVREFAPTAAIVGIEAPYDERRLAFDLHGGSRFRPLHRRLIAELHTNHWNLVLVDAAGGAVVWVLNPRTAAGRVLRPGAAYEAPDPRLRIGPATHDEAAAAAEWERLLRETPPTRLPAALQQRFAFLGPVNLGAVLQGDAGTARPLAADADAFGRWWRLASLAAAQPVLLQLPAGPHPYPAPLPGVAAEPVADLLEAMQRAAQAEPHRRAVETRAPAAWLNEIEERLRRARGRVASLRRRLDRAEDVERARRFGDLLLAHAAAIPNGSAVARLEDWEGRPVEIPLDPALSVPGNAARWYDRARRAQRAAERVPALLAAAEADAARWQRVRDQAADGQLPAALAEELRRGGRRTVPPAPGERLPFRVFRTSGRLAVRVGRGPADNDRLTFGHSRPNDVWLHARSVPGSHVILRWPSADQAPPARDLAEAAGLAAWFSKARSAGLVPVDWTRRKHVRKPRGAVAGAVVPQRVKTLFVEPDASLEVRLAEATAPDEPDEVDGFPAAGG